MNIKANQRFKNYQDVFKDLLKTSNVSTDNPIVSMIISQDSSRALSVTKQDDSTHFIKQFDLETYQLVFEEKIVGRYIKCKEIEQNVTGKKYVVAYNDDGKFYFRTFGQEQQDDWNMGPTAVCVNDILKLNDHTMCNESFPDPYMNVIFADDDNDDLLYVCLFHNATLTHYHFFWSVKDKNVVGKIESKHLGGSSKNFPQKSFYNPEQKEVYTFYRQSQSFIIPLEAKNAEEPYIFNQNISEEPGTALGQMYLIFYNALIVSCSNDIIFFRIEIDEDSGERVWTPYQTLKYRGSIYYIRGNVRVQIVTDEKIYFYAIDQNNKEDPYRATKQNVMNNFMACSQMMFGPKVKYCVTYKTN